MAQLNLVSTREGNFPRHVIFFHGLSGDAYMTWQTSRDIKTCWLYWLDEEIADLAVWSVGYEAAISRLRGSAMHITDRATNILERILLEPKLRTGEIALVGHSLGGLIIKQVLRTAESISRQRGDAAEFLKRVHRVAFLATPHSGSGLATLGDRLRIFIKPSAATQCLVRNDAFLRDLNFWYREWAAEQDIAHLILTENEPVRILGLVVQPDSADPGLLSRPIAVDADHATICKFKNRSSQIYLLIRDFLQRQVDVGPPAEARHRELKALVQEGNVNIVSTLSSLQNAVEKESEKTAEAIKLAVQSASNASSITNFPRDLVDRQVEESLRVLRQARYLVGFSATEESVTLGNKIQSGELQGASDELKSRALAWCARVLALDHGTKADEYLVLARQLASPPEIRIAEAFRLSANGDTDGALSMLAQLKLPIAKSAAFIIVASKNGANAALQWMNKAGLTIIDLDADGKFYLISKVIESSDWELALDCANNISDKDYTQAPILFYSAAIVNLSQAILPEFRSFELQQMLLQAKDFPLAADQSSLQFRRKAQTLLTQCAVAARGLGCLDAANSAEDCALWLELRDPETRESGFQKLQASMRDRSHSLRRLNLAVQFGLNLDLSAVEQEIDQETAISGGKSRLAAMARFALVFAQESPKQVISFIERHRAQLEEFLEKKSVLMLETEMFAQAGLKLRAEECLKELIQGGLSEPEEGRLRRIVSESVGADPIEARKALFDTSGEILDLINLVKALEEQGDQEQLCHYSLILFERTHTLPDAERIARVYNETHQYPKLVTLLRKYPEFLDQSENLQMLWAWSLFREGALAESAEALAKLTAIRDNPNDRALTVNLAITSGDWDTLLLYVESEWKKREQREKLELLQAARIAQIIGSPRAKELTLAAATAGGNDANVLMSAYFLATNAGWDDDPVVGSWLHTSAGLSDESGPIKKMSLKDLFDQAPEWRRREVEIWHQLQDGSIPIFGAATLLNRSLVEMFLLPALANHSEGDLRRRALIPAYSGLRQSLRCDYRVVAMESTAMLTLGVLGLLETACKIFDTIFIPHSTLGWLFSDRQKVVFHQPSRIKDASYIRQFLATGRLKELVVTADIDIDLSAEIGEELAILIAEAQASSVDKRQRVVVRPYPVHRIGSLMEEEADLSTFYSCICSCTTLINKLKLKGQLTLAEEQRAKSYLTLNERQWPSEPDIAEDAVLYLDDLSVTYLQHLKILDRLSPAGFEVYVSPGKTAEINSLLNYERLSSDVTTIIESIRSALASGIRTGKIKVGSVQQPENLNEGSDFTNHPTFSIFDLAEDVEAVIVDDRFLNKHPSINTSTSQAHILTTYDLLNRLANTGNLTVAQLYESRTCLRQAGYIFVQVSVDELQFYLTSAEIVNGRLVETAELKAIRENLLCARMNQFLRLPAEANWIAGVMQVLSQTLKAQWNDDVDLSSAQARSEWLSALIDLRGWSHCFGTENGRHVLIDGYAAQVMALFFAPAKVASAIQEKYLEWIEERLLEDIKETAPDLYDLLVAKARNLIIHTLKTTTTE